MISRIIGLQAHNGQYVCAEDGGGRELVANRGHLKEWELFKVIEHGHAAVYLQAHNGQYVCAEGGGGRGMVANRNHRLEWELFRIIEHENSEISLQAHNGQYVCAEGGGGREVVANRDHMREWERFKVTVLRSNWRILSQEYASDRNVLGFVENNSDNPVFVKPENDNVPVRVDKGEVFEGRHDGLAVPHREPGKVFKTVDNINATVDENGSVSTTGGSFRERIGQAVVGGWRSEPPDEGWNAIFEEARVQPREREERERRERTEREHREYNERLERYERGEREPGEPPRRRDEMNDPF